MTFGQSISTCFRKYATFSGRATRSEFWWFYLFYVIVGAAANFVDEFVLDRQWIGIFTAIVVIAFLLPLLGAGARRLHDTGKSGWFLLLYLIPCVGWIILIVLLAQASEMQDNRFGPAPA